MNSSKNLSFAGSHFFVGFDAHLKNWRVTIKYNVSRVKRIPHGWIKSRGCVKKIEAELKLFYRIQFRFNTDSDYLRNPRSNIRGIINECFLRLS